MSDQRILLTETCLKTNPSKDLSYKGIVKAIANLEAANISLANQFIALNHWNY